MHIKNSKCYIELQNIKINEDEIMLGEHFIVTREGLMRHIVDDVVKEHIKLKYKTDSVFWISICKDADNDEEIDSIYDSISLFSSAIRVAYFRVYNDRIIDFLNVDNDYSGAEITYNQERTTRFSNVKRKRIMEIKMDDEDYIENILMIEGIFSNDIVASEVRQRIANSVTWLGESIETTNSIQSFVKAMSSLESLLGKNIRGGIKDYLADNTSKLLSKRKCCSRSYVYNRVRELYKIRSKIIHGEITVCDSWDLDEIKMFTQESILCVANNKELLSLMTFSELEDYLNNEE